MRKRILTKLAILCISGLVSSNVYAAVVDDMIAFHEGHQTQDYTYTKEEKAKYVAIDEDGNIVELKDCKDCPRKIEIIIDRRLVEPPKYKFTKMKNGDIVISHVGDAS